MRNRRLPLVPLSLALAVALGAACGAQPGSAATGPPRPEPDRAASAPAPVVEVRLEGTSAAAEPPAALPRVLMMGDGRVLTPGAVPAIYPGPLTPPVLEQRIGTAGVERIVERARRAGLLRDIRYAGPSDDRKEPAVPTVVTLRVDGRTYVHRVIGLAFGETDPARARVERFLRSLDDIGQRPPYPTGFVPDRYLVAARPAADDPLDAPAGVRPTVVDWPAATGVRLADARRCATVPAAVVRDTLERADQLTLFRDGGVVYRVSPVPQVPGTGCRG